MAVLGSFWWDSLAAIGLLLGLLYLYATSEFSYFKKRGIPFVPPTPFVGSFPSVLSGRDNLFSAFVPVYERFKKNRFCGMFLGGSPALLVCDPELAKTMLTRDFASVHDRGLPFDEEREPIVANLATFPGARWKNLRSKMTPTFTSGKLKMMFPLIQDCTSELIEYLKERAVKEENTELYSLIKRYCTNVIGSCAFGIQCNSLKNTKSEFYEMSCAVFRSSVLSIIRFFVFPSSELIIRVLPFNVISPGIEEFFTKLMKDTISFRRANNVERNDFVQLMMQQQKNDESKSPKDYPDEVVFTDKVVAAQAFVFFIAGLDSIANPLAFALYQLSLDPRLQQDLADEVISVIRNNNDELTYDTLKEMKLLDRVLSETLRLYPSGGDLSRVITSSKYTIPGTDITLERNTKVIIPVQAFHLDPDVYPDPHKFDPDRFTEEAISQRHPFSYLPFGEGPRMCIASRFANLELKLCLASLVKEFEFSLCSKTTVPIEFAIGSFSPSPKDSVLHLKIKARSH